jgi:ClpP class serine protease
MKFNISSLFWIFFMIVALQPLLRKRFLLAMRQRIIANFEKKRSSRVIVLIHRQETMSLLGFPIFRYIDIDDSEKVIRAIHMTDPDMSLDLVLHTPGGLVLASYQIAHAIKLHRCKVTVFVPHYAMSGGTLIALAADEIMIEAHAVLGPVDPQLGEYPAVSLVKLAENKPISDIDDKSWLLADIGRKAIEQMNWMKEPKETKESGGRFLALVEKFLDPHIYRKGREITVAGLSFYSLHAAGPWLKRETNLRGARNWLLVSDSKTYS